MARSLEGRIWKSRFVPPRIFSKVNNQYLSPPFCPLFRPFATKYDVNMAGLVLVTILKMGVNMRTLILFVYLLLTRSLV